LKFALQKAKNTGPYRNPTPLGELTPHSKILGTPLHTCITSAITDIIAR